MAPVAAKQRLVTPAAARVAAPGELNVPRVADDLLAWYDAERRELPWRAASDAIPDPYRVWLSEIMLQQTTVKAVIPYYLGFLERWPTVGALAAADLEEVLTAWAGLGYYARARNMHRCARFITTELGGRFPQTEAELRALPGVGPYTAAAIAAIAFGEAATPVDGNVERVVARLFRVIEPLPGAKRVLRGLAATLTPDERTGDFAQAMMDLGATVCTPRRPSCLMCPLARGCAAHASGIAAELPYRRAKAERPTRHAAAFVALREDGAVLLRQRPASGLLAGMLEVPSTDWVERAPATHEAVQAAPLRGDWWAVPGLVVHTFTHFRLELAVHRAIVSADAPLTFWADAARCRWVQRRHLDRQPLPSLMRKVIAHALVEM